MHLVFICYHLTRFHVKGIFHDLIIIRFFLCLFQKINLCYNISCTLSYEKDSIKSQGWEKK